MLLRKGMILLVLSVLVVAMTAASVGATSAISNNGPSLKNLKSGTGGYVVTFGSKSSSESLAQSQLMGTMSLNNYITQGQTLWAQKTLSGFTTTTGADLKWGNPSNSLSLTVYTPDGCVLGPYYDNCDGLLNGDVPVQLSRSGGVAQGTYYYQIYGDRVSGSQYFTFT